MLSNIAKHGKADSLLRLPLDVIEQSDESGDADVICTIEEQQLDYLPIQACLDPVISQVYSYTLNIGGQHHPNHYQICKIPFFNKRFELYGVNNSRRHHQAP